MGQAARYSLAQGSYIHTLSHLLLEKPRKDGHPAEVRLDSAPVCCKTLTMEVQFTAEQEAKLGQIASMEGIAPARLVQDAVLLLIEEDERFRAGVRKGIEQADQGMFIEEAEMDARVSRMIGN